MNCPNCGHPDIPPEAKRCPNCQAPLRPAGDAHIDVDVDVQSVEGGDVAGVRIGQSRDVTIVLNTFGVAAGQGQDLAPVVTHYDFIGRQKELEQLLQALKQGRKVQLYGLGGIGKTSLAAETAEQLWAQKTFPQGILWVSEIGLAPLEAICDAIARHLKDEAIPKLPAESKPDATRELLAGRKELLIVLDHIEAPGTVQQFVDRCLPQGGVLLTTSRNRHLASDQDVWVPPLGREEAIALFKSRAQLKSDQGAGAIVGEICDLLGNHALAIVIAAGRVRAESLPLESLKRRLADEKSRIKSLRVGSGDDREHSLWASLNLSYQHLSGEQRKVFHCLAACFAEGTGLPVLAEVCGMDEWETEDIAGELVRRSLIERRGDRLYMQGLVRDFGHSAMGEELPAIQEKALQSLRAFAERYKENIPEHFDRLEAEIGNLLGAAQWAEAQGRCADCVALVKIIARPVSGVLGVRGYWSQLLATGRLGMRAAEACGDRRSEAHLAQYVAIVLQRQDAYQEARGIYQGSLEIYQALGDQINIAVATHNLGMVLLAMGQFPEARQKFEESQALYQAAGDETGVSRSLHEQGRLAFILGDYQEAGRLFKESLAMKEANASKDRGGIALALLSLGRLAREQGDWTEAQAQFASSREIYAERKDPSGLAIISAGLGAIAQEQGRYDEAGVLYQEAGLAFQKLADQDGVAENQLDQGRLARDLGQLEESRARLEQGLKVYQQLGQKSGVAWAQLELAWLSLESDEVAEARRLLEESRPVFEETGEKPGLARSLHLLGRVAFAEGQAAQAVELTGQSLAMHEAMEARPWIARDLHQLGRYAAGQGDETTAREQLEKSLEMLSALGSATADKVRADLDTLK